MKDPAFLFYSRDFYEGTRTMLPHERACLLDLLIYQHQNGGYIPNDIKRIALYCSGIDEATLKDVLQAKFKLCDNGWYNEKLKEIIKLREEHAEKQSYNGKVGQFYKQAAGKISSKNILLIKKKVKLNNLDNKDFYNNWIVKYKDPQTLLEALLKHLANGNEIVNENIISNNGKEGMGEKPTVLLPYTSAEFATQWQLWKNYRHKEHHQNYHSPESEQAALAELNSLAQGQQTTAIAILHQSMGKGWKGLFELKPQGNAGKPPAGKSKVKYSDDFKRKIAQRLQSG